MIFVNHYCVFPETPDLEAQLKIIRTLNRLIEMMKKYRIKKTVSFAPLKE